MRVVLEEKGLFVYGLFLSSVISLIAYLFLFGERVVSEMIWNAVLRENSFRLVYVVAVCLVGGILVGMCRQHWGDVPRTAHDAIAELKQEKTLHYTDVHRHLLTALLILIFGAGVGPEAALLGVIISLSVWQADKLRYLYYNREQFKHFSLSTKLNCLLNPLKYLERYEAKRANHEDRQREKLWVYGLFLTNGLATFYFLMKLTKQPSFVTKIGVSHWQWQELWWLLPLMLFGLLCGYGYRWLTKVCTSVFAFWQDFPLRKALLGSLAIMVLGIYLPNLLSSGQTALHLVPTVSLQLPFATLSLLVLTKLLFLQICLQTGWVGGDIFPIAFAAILQGFAVAQLLPQVDTLFVVAAISASMVMSALRQPLLGLFVALFFPLNLFPLFIVVMLVCYSGQQVKKRVEGRRNGLKN